MLSSFNTNIVLRSGEDEKIYIPKIYIPKCSLIGFYSSKEISIVALFVSLNASIFLLSTSFRILFFPDLSVFPVPQFPRFLVTFQNFTLERPSVFHMHRSFNENLHAGYATSLHDET